MSLPGRIASLAQRDALTTIGLVLSAAWLFLVLLFWLLAPGGDGGAGGVARLVAMIGVVLPLALIWMAITLARAIALLRAEADDLRGRLSHLRRILAESDDLRVPDDDAADGAPLSSEAGAGTGQRSQRNGAAFPPPPPDPHAAGAEAAAPSPSPAMQPAIRTTPRAAQPVGPAAGMNRMRPASDLRQQAMRFDGPESVNVDPDTLIRALNFPDGPDDTGAVAALRLALRDHDNSRVLRAAQDVITLLAGQDIYMDNLPPDPAPVIIWRRFAEEGARGSAVAALGGIHDPQTLDSVAEMLRGNEIFRDTAHHFLRHFDLMLSRLSPRLTDEQMAVLADSRSARAFMVVGRAAGIFG